MSCLNPLYLNSCFIISCVPSHCFSYSFLVTLLPGGKDFTAIIVCLLWCNTLAELKALCNGVKNSLTDRLKSREVKETKCQNLAESRSLHPPSLLYMAYYIYIFNTYIYIILLLYMAYFHSRQTKWSTTAAFFTVLLTKTCMFFSEMIINKRKKNRAAVL